MRSQNITGGVLFLIGTIFLLFFTNFGSGDAAVYFGYATGQTLIFLLIILLVLAATPYRKKIALALVFGGIWFASSAFLSIELYRKGLSERTLSHDFVELLDSLSSNKEISVIQKAPKNLSLMDLMQNYMSRVQAISNEYSKTTQAAGLAGMLTPQNLTQPEALKNALEKISILEKSIPNYESRLINEISTFEMHLSERHDKESIEALRGFLESKDDGERILKMYYQNQADIFKTMRKIISLAIELKGKLQVRDKQLLFKDQESLDIYNSYLQQLAKLSEDEEKILLYQRNQITSGADRLIKLN